MHKGIRILAPLLFVMLAVSIAMAAYHHEGEQDSDKFLAVYTDKVGTKLDHCALCHTGGEYEKKAGKWVSLGSCQWCHSDYGYGYDGSGNIEDTLNPYGQAYRDNGRSSAAIQAIENLDSDGDGYTNKEEIDANRFPGNADDDPTKTMAPYRVYTKAQLEAMAQHTQFLLMNTSRSGDFYAEYTGVPMEDLLEDAGILDSATGILVYAPDGWSQDHPLEEDADPELYHVNGTYPSSVFYYDEEADQALNPTDGWCDYSASSCTGRSHLDPITNTDGLKVILAYKREGAYMDPGVLNDENKLDGEGPFRVVPPQKNPGPPDQTEDNTTAETIWPYEEDGDHNAGSASRTATIIKVEPLPEGTTDIDVLEAGWDYVDQEKIVIYGAINGTDSNGNGILDSEEAADPTADFDGDGTPDYMDPDTATLRHANGLETMCIHTSQGSFANVTCLADDDPAVSQENKPSMTFPYGATSFEITGLTSGASVTVGLVFPDNVPTSAQYYKISNTNGWQEIPFDSNDGDQYISITLTDGDPLTDSDGTANGTIVDPGALATTTDSSVTDTPVTTSSSSSGGSSGCFIATAIYSHPLIGLLPTLAVIFLLTFGLIRLGCRAVRK